TNAAKLIQIMQVSISVITKIDNIGAGAISRKELSQAAPLKRDPQKLKKATNRRIRPSHKHLRPTDPLSLPPSMHTGRSARENEFPKARHELLLMGEGGPRHWGVRASLRLSFACQAPRGTLCFGEGDTFLTLGDTFPLLRDNSCNTPRSLQFRL